MIHRVCQQCGKEFHRRSGGIGKGTFCSVACRTANRRPDRYVDVHGYAWIWREDGRRVSEHRWLTEQRIGRPLRRDEHVHHINGDKLDNRPENLQVLSHTEHMRLHHLSRSTGSRLELLDSGLSSEIGRLTGKEDDE